MHDILNSLTTLLRHPIVKKNTLVFFLKLLFWQINKRIFHLTFKYNFFSDLSFFLEPSSSYGALTFYTKLPDYYEMSYLLNNLNDSDYFIDIGANIGIFTLLASSKVKKGKLFAFEPNKNVKDKLEKNIKLNNIKNCNVIGKIVSDENKKMFFELNSTSELSRISLKKTDRSSNIDSVTLDEFIVENRLTRVNFLKIDVEGAECLVLKGANKSLKRKLIRNIIFEVNPSSKDFNCDAQSTLALLHSSKYKIFKFGNKGLIEVNSISDLETIETINLLAVA